MPAGFQSFLMLLGEPAGNRTSMPNPLDVLGPSERVSSSRDVLNQNFARRHYLGRTALTETDDTYDVLADDEWLEVTLTADDLGVQLPDPADFPSRSIYVFCRELNGNTLTLLGTINGAMDLALTSDWAGGRLVAGDTDWMFVGG